MTESQNPSNFQDKKIKYKYSIVACARWEENDIVEWIEYHKSIGFEHFYIYSNDDDPMILFKRLSPYIFSGNPSVTYNYWPHVGQQPQMYYHFMRNYKHETEWFCFLDIDEFFVLKGIDDISQFMTEFESNYDAVYFNWLTYGNNDFFERESDSILLYYYRRSSTIDVHTKVMTRSSCVDETTVRQRYDIRTIAFWHFWNDYYGQEMRITNVLKDKIDDYAVDFPKIAGDYIRRPDVSRQMIDKAYIAHFQFKSEKDFLRRAARGGFDNAPMWGKMASSGSHLRLLAIRNEVQDYYLVRYWLRLRGELFNFGSTKSTLESMLHNLALRRPSTQSSVYKPSHGSEPARAHVRGHGNDGIRTGTYGFHTAFEASPWWMVDLLDLSVIHEIRIYNRVDDPRCAERAKHIVIEVGKNGEDWLAIFVSDGRSVFGGINSAPLVLKMSPGLSARFVRIRSLQPTCLHLDEVEIYGTALGQ
jgi:hypothetical protein